MSGVTHYRIWHDIPRRQPDLTWRADIAAALDPLAYLQP